MSGNLIQYLPDKSFSGNKKLTILRLKNNPIMSVGLKAFANLPRLENLWVYICLLINSCNVIVTKITINNFTPIGGKRSICLLHIVLPIFW